MGPDAWVALFWQTAALAVAVLVAAGALFGGAVARWAGYPLWAGILLGIFAPLLGPVVAALVAIGRRSRDPHPKKRRRRRLSGLWLLAPLCAIGASYFSPWLSARLPGLPGIQVFAAGHFIDVLLLTTFVIVAAATALVTSGGYVQMGSILLLTPIVAWVAVLWLISAMTNVANSVIGGVSAAMPTTNELWGLFGVDPGSAPASLLEAGLGSYDLSEATKSVSVELGPGWFFMLAAAAAAATWACWAAFVPPSSRKTVAQPRPDDGDASERGPLISGA